MFSLIAYTFNGQLEYGLYLSAMATTVRYNWLRDSRYKFIAVRRYDCLITARRALAQAKAKGFQPKEMVC